MEKNKATYQRIVDYSADLMDKHFPKGECKERGKALVFNAELITYVMQELDKAREEGYEKGKDYQARLDRELYGMSFEQIKSGDFNLKTKEDEK